MDAWYVLTGRIEQMGALLAAMNMGRTASSPSVGARRSVTAIDSSESSRSRLEALRTQMSSTQSLIINAATPTPSEAETHANVLQVRQNKNKAWQFSFRFFQWMVFEPNDEFSSQSITVGYNELTSGTVSLLTGMVSTLTDALSGTIDNTPKVTSAPGIAVKFCTVLRPFLSPRPRAHKQDKNSPAEDRKENAL